MSEKALRGYIKGAIEIYEALEQKGLDSGGIPMILNAALADDPDVVDMLRWLDTEENLGEIVLAEDDDLMPDEYRDFIAMAGWIRDVKGWIERTFHVRLTDGGYEWTD